jgi:hypothetical protein
MKKPQAANPTAVTYFGPVIATIKLASAKKPHLQDA